jgi:2-polyprenyl-3-methyl-5-hydroxy-6-metoxy-1,4-benzoquinol methylase
MDQLYSEKSQSYFNRARLDILPLFPEGAGRVLEVGCGNGATLDHLKKSGLATEVHGMELMSALEAEARENVDVLWLGDAVELVKTFEPGQYNVILCLDVLEHLVDPWSFLASLNALLVPGGCVIASIPNLRTFPVIWNLLFGGRFDYVNQGIMDQTHLRFFTKKTALSLMGGGGLRVVDWRRSPMAKGSKSQWFNGFTLGLFRDFLTEQYLVKAIKS